MDFDALQEKLLRFRQERDWEQFHDPKNLAEGLAIEAAELLENFLWKDTHQSRKLTAAQRKRVKEEVGDIFAFLVYLCYELDIDLFEAAGKKININRRKYPIKKSRGKSAKYTEL